MATNNQVTNVGEGTREWWKEWGTGLDNLNQAKWDPSALYREQDIAQQSLSNQMLSNQATALDTIRKANASAIASGANAGLSAANQLSSVLGLQQETAQASTELANRHITEAISGEQATLANFRELLNTGAAMLQSEAAMGDVQSRNLAYAAEALNKRLEDKKLSESERKRIQEELDRVNRDLLNIKETNTTAGGEGAPTVNTNVIPEERSPSTLADTIISNEEFNSLISDLDFEDVDALKESINSVHADLFDNLGRGGMKVDEVNAQIEVLEPKLNRMESLIGESNLALLKSEYDYFNKLDKSEKERLSEQDKQKYENIVSIYSNYKKLKDTLGYLKDRDNKNPWDSIGDDWSTTFSAFDDGYQPGDVIRTAWKGLIKNPLKTVGHTAKGILDWIAGK